MEWLDIETAPKDGTWFWGLCDGADAIHMVWHHEFDAFVSGWRRMTFAQSYGGGERDHSPDICYPTHWAVPILPHQVKGPAPLPAPPA